MKLILHERRLTLSFTGCPEWKHWTGFWFFNYIVYFFFAVRLASSKICRSELD